LKAQNGEERAKIVVVEDNRDLLDNVVLYLRRSGFDAVGMADSLSLDRWYAEAGIDILVLDVNLPGEDGISIASRLSGNPALGIIMLTGRSDISDRVKGLEGGRTPICANRSPCRNWLPRSTPCFGG
jgi:DNA-binding response OmpR family regulator